MSKIKEIRERLTKNPEAYTTLRFTLAKHIFTLVTAAYFVVYLFTI